MRGGLRAIVGSRRVSVAPLPHLVALKMAADRPQDEADLLALLAREDLDYGAARDLVYRHLGHFAARRLDRSARAAQRKDVPADYENGDS